MAAEVRVIRPEQRDAGTAQTPGMSREEGAGAATVGAEHIWVGYVTVDEAVRSAPHHHGETESVIYVIRGRARFRYGEQLEHAIEAQTGDFVFVPPYLVHQEINSSDAEPVEMIVARSAAENVVVNVEMSEEIERA